MAFSRSPRSKGRKPLARSLRNCVHSVSVSATQRESLNEDLPHHRFGPQRDTHRRVLRHNSSMLFAVSRPPSFTKQQLETSLERPCSEWKRDGEEKEVEKLGCHHVCICDLTESPNSSGVRENWVYSFMPRRLLGAFQKRWHHNS